MSRAQERHARYYLAKTREALASGDLHQIEDYLPNLQRAWGWICEQGNSIELVLEYGRLAWWLFDLVREHLHEVVETLQSLESSTPKASYLRLIADKLDELLRTQANIQSVLESDPRYSVKIEHAYGVAIGEHARIEISPP